jgi:hypothetical protein
MCMLNPTSIILKNDLTVYKFFDGRNENELRAFIYPVYTTGYYRQRFTFSSDELPELFKVNLSTYGYTTIDNVTVRGFHAFLNKLHAIKVMKCCGLSFGKGILYSFVVPKNTQIFKGGYKDFIGIPTTVIASPTLTNPKLILNLNERD